MIAIDTMQQNDEIKIDIEENYYTTRSIGVYKYTRTSETTHLIKVYDYTIEKNDNTMYYTVCCVIGNSGSLDDAKIVRFPTDVIDACECVYYITPGLKRTLLHNSYKANVPKHNDEMIDGYVVKVHIV